MKEENRELVVCVYDNNAPSINDKILEAFERYLGVYFIKYGKSINFVFVIYLAIFYNWLDYGKLVKRKWGFKWSIT